KFSAGGVARVVEGEGGSGRYSIETTGADLVTPAGEKVNKWEGSIDFPQQKALPLNMPMQVSAPGYDENGELRLDSITVRMAVQRTADKAGDAFEVSIPLLMDRQPEKTATFAELTPDSAFKWEALPEAYRPNTLNRELLVSDQLSILKVLAGLRFLMNYPHGCTEQRVSYAYPSLAYTDIWKEMGLESPDPDLKKYVQRTLEFLAKVQKPDGLFSYWPGSKGYVYLTAYIVEFLLEVEKANQQDGVQYPFDKDMLDRALKALERSLRSDYDQFLSGYKYYERSAALYALTLAGKAETSYLRELATQIRQVDVLSQSRIYLAIYKSDAELDKLRNDLAQRLWDYTIFKLQKGRKVFAGLQEREMRIGAEVHASEITNLAGLIRAFSKSGQSPDKLRMMVDELIILGSVDGWGHTNVNSAA
ncbi:MAG: hypothetical protein GWN30_10450, partial [Gammaproteobacteria bacterium]|nr:hypothetical protein [Gammaproteobacteria bacterium]